MSKKPETLFKEKVLADLKKLKKIWFYKTNDVSRRGIPDIIACIRGKFVAIELKVDSPVSELQEYNLNCISLAKGIAWVATPKNWEVILSAIIKATEEK